MTNIIQRTRLFSSLVNQIPEATPLRDRQSSLRGAQFFRDVDRALENLNEFSRKFENLNEELLQKLRAENRENTQQRDSLSTKAVGSSHNPSITSFRSIPLKNEFDEMAQNFTYLHDFSKAQRFSDSESSLSPKDSPKVALQDADQNFTIASINLDHEQSSESFEIIFPSQKRIKALESFIDDNNVDDHVCQNSRMFEGISPIGSSTEDETFSKDSYFFESQKLELNKGDFLDDSVANKNVTSDTVGKFPSHVNSTVVQDETEKSELKINKNDKSEGHELSTEFSIEFELSPAEIKKSPSTILRENERILADLDNDDVVLAQN